MCFFKQLANPQSHEALSQSPYKPHPDDTSAEILTENEFFSIPDKKPKTVEKADINLMLLNCLGLMNFNSQMMVAMDQKLTQTQVLLFSNDHLSHQSQPATQSSPKRSASHDQASLNRQDQNLFQSSDPLTTKLFGASSYKYKLVVDGEFPETLYKERNFNCSVKLVDLQTGKDLNNGNIINVCLGVCDDNGEWIHETKDGQTFMKGKIETELYHGNAGFVKMAARDVSRIYLNKTVNFVVYPKPTVLRYSGESSIEEHVDFSLIEPLIIHGVSIKAKKRD